MKQNFTIRRGALDGVEAFLSVAQHRSFRRAAAELGVTPSAISQAVRTLEARIGAGLFIRTTRSVGLTEAGQRLFAHARPAVDMLTAGLEAASGLGGQISGRLRINVPGFDAVCRMVQADMGIGLIPDRAFEVIGAGMGLRAIPLRDDWAKRELKIVVRDAAQLSGTGRMVLDHLRGAEQPREPRQRGRINQ